jgi:hypothetical protein
MTVFNARALASLVTVAGSALSRRLTVILNAVVRVLEEDKDEELLTALDEAIKALLASINDLEGLNTLMMTLIGWYVVPYLYTDLLVNVIGIPGQRVTSHQEESAPAAYLPPFVKFRNSIPRCTVLTGCGSWFL